MATITCLMFLIMALFGPSTLLYIMRRPMKWKSKSTGLLHYVEPRRIARFLDSMDESCDYWKRQSTRERNEKEKIKEEFLRVFDGKQLEAKRKKKRDDAEWSLFARNSNAKISALETQLGACKSANTAMHQLIGEMSKEIEQLMEDGQAYGDYCASQSENTISKLKDVVKELNRENAALFERVTQQAVEISDWRRGSSLTNPARRRRNRDAK